MKRKLHPTRIKKLNEIILNKDFYEHLQKQILEENYYEFFKWAFKILHPSDPYSDSKHIKELCDLLQKEVERIEKRIRKKKDFVINIPPRTSKSLIVSVCFLPWVWLRLPHIKMICVSHDDNLVTFNSRLCRNLIKSDKYQHYFADKFKLNTDSDSVTFFANNAGGSRLSKTTGSSIVGHGAHIIVVDDPQSASTSRSEAKRLAVKKYWSEDLYNRLTPAQLGVRILVQQRLHEDDLTGDLLKKKGGKLNHICLPATLTNKNKDKLQPKSYLGLYTLKPDGVYYLDPIRLDRETLEDLKEELGTYGFTSQYDQEPTSEEGGIIKRHWFSIVDPNTVIRDREKEPIHFFIDPAYTEKTSNDPTGIMAAFKKGHEMYIIRSESKRLEFPDLCRYIKEFCYEYGYDHNSVIYVEPKASGLSVVQQLKSETDLNITIGESPKDDKLSRLNAVSPKCEARRVNLIQGGWNEDFLSQICSAGEEQWPEHDDEIDVFSMGVKKLLITGIFDFAFVG